MVCHFLAAILQVVVSLRDTLAAEGVGADDVGTSLQIFAVYVSDDVGSGQVEHVVVALHHHFHILKTSAFEVGFVQMILLYHGTHSTIEYQYSFFCLLLEPYDSSLFKSFHVRFCVGKINSA